MEKEQELLDKVKAETEKTVETKNAAILAEFKKEMQGLVDQARKGMIDETTYKGKIEEFEGRLKEFDADKFKAYQESLEKLENALKEQGIEMKKLKEGGLGEESKETLRKKLKEIISSDNFKEFVESGGKKKASFEMKTVSVTSDYTGNSLVHITRRDQRVVDYPEVVRLNIRDLLTVSPIDLPYLAFIEVYDWDRQVGATGENDTLSESAFKVREATADAKRIGTHVPISKRMLRSATYVENHLASRLPAMVRYNEDFQLLFGDGQGNNLTGLFQVARDFATIINTSETVTAGQVESVESYDDDDKALITFTVNKNIKNGDIITIANATNAGYNDSFTALVISPKQIVIEEAYVAEADTSAWTATINNPFADSIDSAQQIDVLKVAKALVTQEEYMASGYVLNPVDATKIETLKGNDQHYIEIQRDEQGVLRISGLPVVETTAMPAGRFACGDFRMAAALFEFTQLTLEFSESTQEKLKNSVEAIVQEEVIFPIYNKYMFVTGDFTTAAAALETP